MAAYGDGLSTTVLPARIAGITCQLAMRTGKFHGVIEPTTPMGCGEFDAPFVIVLKNLDGDVQPTRGYAVHARVPPISHREPSPCRGLPALA